MPRGAERVSERWAGIAQLPGTGKNPTSWPCGCISAQEEMGKAGFGWDGHSAGTMGCLERLGWFLGSAFFPMQVSGVAAPGSV